MGVLAPRGDQRRVDLGHRHPRAHGVRAAPHERERRVHLQAGDPRLGRGSQRTDLSQAFPQPPAPLRDVAASGIDRLLDEAVGKIDERPRRERVIASRQLLGVQATGGLPASIASTTSRSPVLGSRNDSLASGVSSVHDGFDVASRIELHSCRSRRRRAAPRSARYRRLCSRPTSAHRRGRPRRRSSAAPSSAGDRRRSSCSTRSATCWRSTSEASCSSSETNRSAAGVPARPSASAPRSDAARATRASRPGSARDRRSERAAGGSRRRTAPVRVAAHRRAPPCGGLADRSRASRSPTARQFRTATAPQLGRARPVRRSRSAPPRTRGAAAGRRGRVWRPACPQDARPRPRHVDQRLVLIDDQQPG